AASVDVRLAPARIPDDVRGCLRARRCARWTGGRRCGGGGIDAATRCLELRAAQRPVWLSLEHSEHTGFVLRGGVLSAFHRAPAALVAGGQAASTPCKRFPRWRHGACARACFRARVSCFAGERG